VKPSWFGTVFLFPSLVHAQSLSLSCSFLLFGSLFLSLSLSLSLSCSLALSFSLSLSLLLFGSLFLSLSLSLLLFGSLFLSLSLSLSLLLFGSLSLSLSLSLYLFGSLSQTNKQRDVLADVMSMIVPWCVCCCGKKGTENGDWKRPIRIQKRVGAGFSTGVWVSSFERQGLAFEQNLWFSFVLGRFLSSILYNAKRYQKSQNKDLGALNE